MSLTGHENAARIARGAGPVRGGRPGRNGAFTLLQMVVTLVVLSVFTVIAGRLIPAAVGLVRVSQKAPAADHRFDTAVRRLRADVWNASGISVEDERTLILRGGGAGDRTITWRMGSDDDEPVLRRTVSSGDETVGQRAWPFEGAGLTFERRGPAVRVVPAGRGLSARHPIPLYSQVRMLR